MTSADKDVAPATLDADAGESLEAPPAPHPRHELDELLTHAVRLSVVAALHGMERVEFALVRDTVQVSDSMLSKQVALLENAGYVEVEKGKVGRRPRTWLSLSAHGEGAFARHVAALQAIATGLLPT